MSAVLVWAFVCNWCEATTDYRVTRSMIVDREPPFLPDGWVKITDDAPNGMHLCPSCMQKAREDQRHVRYPVP